jgi:nucleoside-diphosphate-sugar epimerase
MKKILVTGATGRVGSRFVRRLLANGDGVRVLVRDPERAAWLATAGAEVIAGDLRDPAAVAGAVGGVDAVVNLAAAFRGVPDEEAEAINHRAAVELAEAALAAGVTRHVLASTNLVYGPGRGRPTHEDDPPQPAGAYPVSKVAAEDAVRGLAGLDARVIRFAFVYGEGDPHLRESLMWARDWPAHQRLHLVHHADVGQALLLVLRAEGIGGRVYHVGDDAPVTAAELHALNGEEMAPDAADRPLADPWSGIIDTTRIRTELGFRPIYPSVYTARDAGAL